MKRGIEFGIEAGKSTKLSISGPSTPLRTAGRRCPEVALADRFKMLRYSEIKPGTKAIDEIGEVTINLRKAAAIQNKREKREVLRSTLRYLLFMGSGQVERLGIDSRIQLHGGIVDPDAEDGLAVSVKTPDMSDAEGLEEAVVGSMRGTAKDLGQGGRLGTPSKWIDRTLARTVCASIKPEGVELSASDHNGAKLATGEDYNPESGLIHLYNRELTNPAQQIVCLAGAIEIAQTK